MRRPLALTALAAASLALAACGGGDNKPAASGSTSAAPSSSAQSTWDCSPNSQLSQEDWVKHCAAVDNSTASQSALRTVKLGLPYELTDSDDPNSRQTMTVKGVECGLMKLPNGAPNPKWDGSNTIPETITATADPGMEFCRVTASWQNTGKKPLVGWTDFENLVTTDGTEFAEDQKAEQATQYINEYGMPSKCAPYVCSTINPGAPAFDVVKIYQIPAGTKPAAVHWPRATIDSGPAVQFALH